MWSWVLSAVSLLGFYLCGDEPLYGWALSVGAEVLWIIYGLQTNQFGFVFAGFVYGVVFARNWTVTHEAKQAQARARKKLFGG